MAIELRNIYKSFGDKTVFRNFNLILPNKQINIIMGPSGSGKTTLVNMLCGLLLPDYGKISSSPGHTISVVFQEDRLLEHLSGLKNILYVSKNPKIDEGLAWDLLNEAGLAEDAYRRAGNYSGGMKRRLALCRALAADYSLLILDEPFKGLDTELKPKIMNMVKRRNTKKTVLIITHDASEAEFFGTESVEITTTRYADA